MWLSTGTVAPNALLSRYSYEVEGFPYLVNVDHAQWKAFYHLLQGDDPALWKESVVLRRILLPALSYPFWLLWGFEAGGVIANMFIQWVALLTIAVWSFNRWGREACIAAVWLVATFPGTIYWSGLPYAYAFIVPGCLFAMPLLMTVEDGSVKKSLTAAALLGVLCLGYDFAPILIPACTIILAARRKFLLVPFAVLLMAAPSLLWSLILHFGLDVSLINDNTTVYRDLLLSYLTRPDFGAWAEWLRQTPFVFVHNYLFSTWIFVPIAFIGMFLLYRRRPGLRLRHYELAMLGSIMALWLFVNMAPPYEGWTIRGCKYGRLYQPMLIPILSYLVRAFGALIRQQDSGPSVIPRIGWGLLCVVVIMNGVLCFGPIMGNPYAGRIFQEFYEHSHEHFSFRDRQQEFKRRILGF